MSALAVLLGYRYGSVAMADQPHFHGFLCAHVCAFYFCHDVVQPFHPCVTTMDKHVHVI